MRSPCLECHLLGKSKENDECFNCKKRMAYVAHIGVAEHNIPVAQIGHQGQEPKRIEGVKVEQHREASIVETRTTKTCRACNRTKPISDFSKQVRSSDGHMHICRSCHGQSISGAAKDKRPVGRPPKSVSDAKIIEKPHTPPPLTHKRCRECKCIKAVEEFLANALTKDGYSHICKACWKTANHRPDSDSRQIIRLDFTDHREALQELKNHAERELRTPEMHALYILKKTLTSTAER